MNNYKSNKLDNKFDAGPLIALKKGLILEELKKNASIEDRFIDLIIKIINSGRKGQRFAVIWRAGPDQKLIISIGATVDTEAKEEEIKKLEKICGYVIVPKKGSTGIVHKKLKIMEFFKAAKQGKDALNEFKKCIYGGGLSFGIDGEYNEEFLSEDLQLVFTTRSTEQFNSQDLNNLAKMGLYFDFENDTGTQYDPEVNEFTNRDNALAYNIRRTSIKPLADLVSETILNALIKKEKNIQLSNIVFIKNKIEYSDYKHKIYDRVWEQSFRYNKENIAEALLTTICVACGYNDTRKPGPFWINLSDDQIVFKAVEEAKKIGINLDLNRIPDPLKGVCGQLDFSTTALMFAAKKIDIPVEKRLNLIAFLLKHGADPAQKDKNGHDAIWYAKSKGNTEIEEYLRMTMSFHHLSSKGPSNTLFKKDGQLDNEREVPPSRINLNFS